MICLKLCLERTKSVSTCGVSHTDIISPNFLNPGMASPHSQQSMDKFVNGSDMQNGEPWPLLCPPLSLRTQVASCMVPWCQSALAPREERTECCPGPERRVDSQKKKVFTDRKGEMTEKEKKKICQPRESTVLLGEIHTVMSWCLHGRKQSCTCITTWVLKKEKEK